MKTKLCAVAYPSALPTPLSQTDVTLPLQLNSPSADDLYKPKSDIKLPSADKLEAFRRLILIAKTGDIELTDTISEVRVRPCSSRPLTLT